MGRVPIPLMTRKQKLPPERKCGGQEPDRSPPAVDMTMQELTVDGRCLHDGMGDGCTTTCSPGSVP